jgi:hypothetical protein
MERKNLSGWSVPLDDILSYSNSDQAAVKCQLSTTLVSPPDIPISQLGAECEKNLHRDLRFPKSFFVYFCLWQLT